MKAAVTGASGHIGNNICRRLLEEGIQVKALVRNDQRSLEGLNVELVKGDLLDDESLRRLLRDVDVVFHLAAVISIKGNSKGTLNDVNVEGTKRLANLCLNEQIKRFIHFSSIHALNQYPLDTVLTEENALVNHNAFAYDRSKSNAEKVILDLCEKGLNAVILNPTSVIGVHDYKPSLIGQAFLRIAGGKLPALIPGGSDWVDVRDVCQGAISAINKGRKGERYLLSGHWFSIEDLAEEIGKHSKKKKPVKVSTTLAKLGLPFMSLYSKLSKTHPLYTKESLEILASSNKNISSQKAETELAYVKRPFSETIEDTFNWFKNNQMIRNL